MTNDASGFHIVNFPFMSSNIPSAPAYGVYASQLIRYACCCSNYSDFLPRHTLTENIIRFVYMLYTFFVHYVWDVQILYT